MDKETESCLSIRRKVLYKGHDNIVVKLEVKYRRLKKKEYILT